MKQAAMTILILIYCATATFAQGAIYTCGKTGAWGEGHNEKNVPTTIKECDEAALRMCKQNKGTACKQYYQSARGGWWGFIASKDTRGRLYFQVSDGNVSKVAAEQDARKKFKEHGGPYPDLVPVQTWYVYTKPAK